MALAKKPSGKRMITGSNQITSEQKAFISDSLESANPTLADGKKKPVMLRVDPDDLQRIDRIAKKLGLKRAAFFVNSALERVGRIESGS